MSTLPFFDDRQETIQTFTGGRFSVVNPQPDEVNVRDVAHALSMVCRFNGHVSTFYNVASHALHVMKIVEHLGGSVRERFYALHHEDSEAYLGDMPRPIKHLTELGTHYRVVEEKVMDAVAARYGVPMGFHKTPIVKRADELALILEARALMADPEWAQRYATTLDIPTGLPEVRSHGAIANAEQDFLAWHKRLAHALELTA